MKDNVKDIFRWFTKGYSIFSIITFFWLPALAGLIFGVWAFFGTLTLLAIGAFMYAFDNRNIEIEGMFATLIMGNILVMILTVGVFEQYAERLNEYDEFTTYKIEKYVDADYSIVTPNKIIKLDETEYWKIKAGRCEEIQKITTLYDKKFVVVETGYSEVSYECKGE